VVLRGRAQLRALREASSRDTGLIGLDGARLKRSNGTHVD
jgi:hypothetical protein